MTERIDPKNEKETRKHDAHLAKSLLIRAGLSQEKQIIEKEVIKEVEVPVEKIVEKEIEVIKEVDNPALVQEIKELNAMINDDIAQINKLKKELDTLKKANQKLENLKKLLDSSN